MAVQVAYKHSRSWRALAEDKGVSHNVLYALAHGEWSKVSWETHRMVRRKFDLPDPGPLSYVTPCPSCHGIHIAGDCHNAPISAVVILAPGERVTDAPHVSRETLPAPRPRKARKAYYRPCLSLDHTERIAQCERIIEEARRATCYLSTQ
jgi:hypothetical protein